MSSDGRDDELAACLVRARVVVGGSDRRVSMVRVGWLTPDLATAVADDVRHAPSGTWLELLVPDDLADAEIAAIREWLRSLISPHVRVEVGRSTDRVGELMGPSATPPCGELPYDASDASEPERQSLGGNHGTHLARERRQLHGLLNRDASQAHSEQVGGNGRPADRCGRLANPRMRRRSDE